jgi:hypothetical protein
MIVRRLERRGVEVCATRGSAGPCPLGWHIGEWSVVAGANPSLPQAQNCCHCNPLPCGGRSPPLSNRHGSRTLSDKVDAGGQSSPAFRGFLTNFLEA